MRFLCCCPKPAFHTADQINAAKDLTCSLKAIFYTVYKSHTDKRVYTMTEEAAHKYGDCFTDFLE